jgi:hypothetical protein
VKTRRKKLPFSTSFHKDHNKERRGKIIPMQKLDYQEYEESRKIINLKKHEYDDLRSEAIMMPLEVY